MLAMQSWWSLPTLEVRPRHVCLHASFWPVSWVVCTARTMIRSFVDTSDLIDAKIRTPRPAYLTPLHPCETKHTHSNVQTMAQNRTRRLKADSG